MFYIPSNVAHDDDMALLLQENEGKCVVCKSAYDTCYGSYMVGRGAHYLAHHIQHKSFVICDNCVNVCVNIKIELVKSMFCYNNSWYLTDIKTSSDNGHTYNKESMIHIIDQIIDHYLNLVETCYKFKNKSALLLLMSHNDQRTVLNFLPKDLIIFILKFIYYDKM